MKIIADLQVHSRHARATSKDLSLDNLEKWGRIRGLDLIGTGDFQHPIHRKEIESYLKDEREGILYSKSGFAFLWQTEVSLMFSQGGKKRAVHLLVFAPNKNIADKIISYLGSKGRLDYDGRPIFGISCRDFVKDLKEIDDLIEIIPAHCMTPWFGLFGSDSGFDSLKDCFLDMNEKIYAIESGMSADPSMLYRFEELSKGGVNVVSFSDAHSFWPWRLGREATTFEVKKLNYENIIKAIRAGEGLRSTIETPPEYGKYHWDGHRNCNFSCSPLKTKELGKICPVCNKSMTIGVDYRVEELAVKKKGFMPTNAKQFLKIAPLHELISSYFGGVSLTSKKVWGVYNSLIEMFKTEFNILLDITKKDFLDKGINSKLVDIILLNRDGELTIKPGYDGEYGKIVYEGGIDLSKGIKQTKLF